MFSTRIYKWLEEIPEPLGCAAYQYSEHDAKGQWILHDLEAATLDFSILNLKSVL